MHERIIESIDVGTGEQLMLLFDAESQLYVDDEPVLSTCALGNWIVALKTVSRMIHIDAADYWHLLHGDVPPSTHEAGHMAAQLEHIRSHARELIDLLAQDSLLESLWRPPLWKAVGALGTALGDQASSLPAHQHAR
jgi:hypothetical protein